MIYIGKNQISDKWTTIQPKRTNRSEYIRHWQPSIHPAYRVYIGDELVYPRKELIGTPYKLRVEYDESIVVEELRTSIISETVTHRVLTIETTFPVFVHDYSGSDLTGSGWEKLQNGDYVSTKYNINGYTAITIPMALRLIHDDHYINQTWYMYLEDQKYPFGNWPMDADKTFILDEYEITEDSEAQSGQKLYLYAPSLSQDGLQKTGENATFSGGNVNHENGKAMIAPQYKAGEKEALYELGELYAGDEVTRDTYGESPIRTIYLSDAVGGDSEVKVNGDGITIKQGEMVVLQIPTSVYSNYYRGTFTIEVLSGGIKYGMTAITNANSGTINPSEHQPLPAVDKTVTDEVSGRRLQGLMGCCDYWA